MYPLDAINQSNKQKQSSSRNNQRQAHGRIARRHAKGRTDGRTMIDSRSCVEWSGVEWSVVERGMIDVMRCFTYSSDVALLRKQEPKRTVGWMDGNA